jgi:hypothetical protein
MEKKQAQEYIKEVLSSKFDQEKFENFMRNLVNNFEPKDNSYSGNLIPEAFREHIAYYKRIGKYTDPEGEQLDILIVQTRSVRKLERARTALRNFVVRHLKSFEKQYALAAFYSREDDGADWRLSLVKIDYEAQRSDQGRIKIKEELVPAKRFSFLVGEQEDSYTAQKQLLPLLTNTYSDPLIVMEQDGDGSIEGAFGIEKVTDEFYEQYKELFLKLSENKQLAGTLKNAGLDPVRFLKKLLGQIVFLYFLQKKGWLGVPKDKKMGEGSKRFLQDRFATIEAEGKNYFNDFLRHLFYAALAREHNDEDTKYYFKDLECKVPFLNGGLFEAEYDWENADIHILNNLFRNAEKNKAGDKGTGILDVFDRYNFTIKEDEPLEKEVAVDPEMLGKVFENMLEITERKSKGAFYTPREIVHYMCQESLIHYLDNVINDYSASYQALDTGQTSIFGGSTDKKGNLKLEMEHKDGIRVPKEDLEEFIRNGHLVLENDEAALAARQRIEQGEIKSTKQKQLLPETISRNAEQLDKALADVKICDPAIGSGAFPVGLLHEIVTARKVLVPHLSREYINTLQIKSGIGDSDTMPSEYYFKRHAIQESIYGVDIDASAIDIARLRLWLSMIVEEEDYETIEALPNLDYKIVCGNSLIGLPENAMRDLIVEAELEELKEKFFHETDENQKKVLREKINTKIRQLLDSAESFAAYKIDFDFKLYFSEVWHQKVGFDIVIGNPPYLNLTRNNYNTHHLKIFNSNFTVLRQAQSKNLFALFIELGLRLMHSQGTISMIVPEGLAQTRSYTDVRKLFVKHKIDKLLTFKEFVFSQAVIGNIVFFTHPNSKEVLVLNFINDSEQTKRNEFTYDKITSNKDWVWPINPENPILSSIEKNSTPLGKLNFSFSKGMVVRDRKKHLRSVPAKEDLPFVLGKNLSRFNVSYTHYANYNELEIVGGTKKLEKHTSVPRLLIRRTGAELCVAYSENPELVESTCYIMTGSPLKLLLGILNSSPVNYYLKSKFITNQQGYPQVLLNDLILLPIKLPLSHFEIEVVTEYLLQLKTKINHHNELIFSFFSSLLDSITFEIYFPEQLDSAKKNILVHLRDIKPITTTMSEEEKLAIIQSEFERLYDPNHPVRNNLETLDSIEEVRIIKNALK